MYFFPTGCEVGLEFGTLFHLTANYGWWFPVLHYYSTAIVKRIIVTLAVYPCLLELFHIE